MRQQRKGGDPGRACQRRKKRGMRTTSRMAMMGKKTSIEEINGPDENAEQDNNASDGENDVNRDAVRGGGGSEVDTW